MLINLDGRGGIIFTSRHESTKVLGRHVLVQSMVDDGGIELLLRDMSSQEVGNCQTEAEDIVRRLGGLALAIEQAAAYISFNRMALPDFIDEYERKKSKVLKYIREELWEYQKQRDGSTQSESLSAFTTWEMSFEQVEPRDEVRKGHVTHFLNVAAYLEPSHIGSYLFKTYVSEVNEQLPWLDLFKRLRSSSDEENSLDDDKTVAASSFKEASWSNDQFWSTIERLYRLSLLQSIEQKPITWFSIHPVISDWLQLREKKRSNRQKRLQEAIGLMSVVVRSPFTKDAPPSRQRELLAHVDACVVNSRHTKLITFVRCSTMDVDLSSFGKFYYDQGEYGRMEELCRELVEEYKRSLGMDDHLTLANMANLVWAYQNQGRWDAAEELGVEAIEASKKKLGVDHPFTLILIHNLASAYNSQGRWEAAEELRVEVIEATKKKLGEDHPHTINAMIGLADTYNSQGRWEAAEDLGIEIIKTIKKQGVDRPSLLTAMNQLALTYSGQGRWRAAEELQLEVVEAMKKRLGADHPGTLMSNTEH